MSAQDINLDDYREQIDALDKELVDTLVRRFKIVEAVGALKSREGLSVVQSARAEAVIQNAAMRAAEQGLDGDLVRRLYTMMIDHAHKLEHDIVDTSANKEQPSSS